ncbi:MAG: TIGR01777 family oxidoreductase [Chloroflexota bacterium]
MRYLITGASGYVGRALAASLSADGHQVWAVSRSPERARAAQPELAGAVGWDALDAAMDGANGVVHLAGESVAGRWTRAKKARLYASRVDTTRALVAAIERAAHRPSVLVSASAAGYYGERGEETLIEASEPGDDFLARLCVEWEAAAASAEPLGVRVVQVRSGQVVGQGAAFLRPQVLAARVGVPTRFGNGRQWWPWVHVDDVVACYRLALQDADVRGPLNATAPEPVRQGAFARALGGALGRPYTVWAPALVLRALLGEMAGEVLTSKRALPQAALAHGLAFAYPELGPALTDALAPTSR